MVQYDSSYHIVVRHVILTQASQISKRLALIDQYLLFQGQVCRANLIKHFGIGIATASRTLKEYQIKYPGNMDYSLSARSYVAAKQFKPAYKHDVDRALALIAFGLDIREVEEARFGQAQLTPFSVLSSEIVSGVTRAMVKEEPIEIEYASGSSGLTKRTVMPRALFQGGGVWYFRAFDTLRTEYRTFRLNRVRSVGATQRVLEHSPEVLDTEWEKQVTLTLAPNPKRENQEALREDLGLIDKPVQNITTNAVTAGFVLIDLRVDCSSDGSLDPFEYHLRLMNLHELQSVDSMDIAPGFNKISRS